MTFLPIVGAHYHPPAMAILSCLPIGTELELLAEPTNPYDPNAIMIFVEGTKVPASEELDSLASGYGSSSAQIIETNYIHLGYVPRYLAAKLVPYSGPNHGTFALDARGSWSVHVEGLNL
jgi:ribulose-5-phosphate 4-epimerase/fuculose-1-phosphate aldolase